MSLKTMILPRQENGILMEKKFNRHLDYRDVAKLS